MKNEWQHRRVSDVAEHSLGKMLDKAKNKGELKPYLRNFNVRWFGFDLSDVLEMRFLPGEAAKYTAVKGDVLICEGGYPGRAAIWGQDEPIYFQKALHRVRFHEPERGRWFLYYLYAKDLDGTLNNHFTGAGIQHFTGEALARFEVPLPPLPEQQRIVGILDEAFEAIATAKANAEMNLQRARALFESHLQAAFTQRGGGWVDRPLEQVGATQTGSTPRTSEAENYGHFIPFVKPADFNRDGSLDYKNDGLTKKGLSEARKVAAGSVLMVCIGATIGKCGYCDREIATNQQVNALTPLGGVYHKFIYFQMLTEDFQRRVLLGSGQATLPIINKSKWGALTVAVPPTLEEQKRIAAKCEALCDETQRLASIYQRKLAGFEALKKSLLHQAFSGNL